MTDTRTLRLKQVFEVAHRFAEKHDLNIECRSNVLGYADGFTIWKKGESLDTDGSVANWHVDIEKKFTLTGFKQHAHLHYSQMFDHWEGGSYNLESQKGTQRLSAFLESALNQHNSKKTQNTHVNLTPKNISQK